MEKEILTEENSFAEKNNETIFTEEEFSTQGYDKHIRQARNACFIAAGLLAVNAILLFSKYPLDIEVMWLDYLLWTIYIGGFIFCGIYTKKKPYTAIIIALCIFALFIIVNAVIDPSTIIGGLLFKIAIVITLIKGMQDAKAAQQMKDQMSGE
jgi:hypothetical protein